MVHYGDSQLLIFWVRPWYDAIFLFSEEQMDAVVPKVTVEYPACNNHHAPGSPSGVVIFPFLPEGYLCRVNSSGKEYPAPGRSEDTPEHQDRGCVAVLHEAFLCRQDP